MSSNQAYAVVPTSGHGAGVLVLHSWFGLNRATKDLCERLADAGFVAVAPDLFEGAVTDDAEAGRGLLRDADANLLAASVQSTAHVLRRMPATPDGPIGVLGLSMGASLGLWLSERRPDLVSAVVGYYGTQGIDFVHTRSAYQLHMTVDDPLIDADELALMEASLHLAHRPVELHEYPEVGHWFAEPGAPGHDEAAAELAWARSIEFLHTHLG